MRGRTILLTVVAFLIGAMAAAGIGVRVIDEVRTSDDATSLPPENISTTTLASSGTYIAENETRVGSTVLVPLDVRLVQRMLAIEYDLVSIAPTAVPGENAQQSFGLEPVAMFPRSWVLRTAAGPIEGGPALPNVKIARFDLPDGVEIADISSVEITSAFVGYPFMSVFELSEANPSVEISDGIVAELVDVQLRGEDQVRVRVELAGTELLYDSITIEGSGEGWLPYSGIDNGHGDSRLTWVGSPTPTVFTFVASGLIWAELDGPFTVSIEGLE